MELVENIVLWTSGIETTLKVWHHSLLCSLSKSSHSSFLFPDVVFWMYKSFAVGSLPLQPLKGVPISPTTPKENKIRMTLIYFVIIENVFELHHALRPNQFAIRHDGSLYAKFFQKAAAWHSSPCTQQISGWKVNTHFTGLVARTFLCSIVFTSGPDAANRREKHNFVLLHCFKLRAKKGWSLEFVRLF